MCIECFFDTIVRQNKWKKDKAKEEEQWIKFKNAEGKGFENAEGEG
jgi:hypothetical protein